MKILSKIFSFSLRRVASSSESSFAFLVCLIALTVAYRIQLTYGLFTNPIKPFDFHPSLHPAWFILAYWPYDLALVMSCFLISWLLSRMQRLTKTEKPLLALKVFGIFLLHIFLMILVLAHGGHLRLLFGVQTGLDFSVVREAFSGVSWIEVIKMVGIRDALFLFLPVGFFWLILLLPVDFKVWVARGTAILIVLFLLPLFFLPGTNQKSPPEEIRLNPLLFLLSDMTPSLVFRNRAEAHYLPIVRGPVPGSESSGVIGSEKFFELPKAKDGKPWNVVFIVMESVGTRYIFDMSHGNAKPMPFLHQLANRGWQWKRHFSSSNFSTKALFSILSGRYDFFNREIYGTRPDAQVPSLNNFLPKDYDRFLVTPTSLSWYFPAPFIRNSGLSEIHHYDNLPFQIKEEYHTLGHYIARDEIQTVDYFIERLSKAKEPFMGLYISFAAHFPYFDYGADYRVLDQDGPLINRYYNNLNLLDQMIKRIYTHLEQRGLAERTIFVIVGDHGQAFGQHQANNYMHYRYSYNENLEAPAIFYQPALFKPGAFDTITSHVDILPTLLEAMGISYDPALFDGESLYRLPLKRKTIFFCGYEESISLLSMDGIKVQHSLKKNKSWAFDLKTDPGEKNPLDASLYPSEFRALYDFAGRHDAGLFQDHASMVAKKRESASQAPGNKEIP